MRTLTAAVVVLLALAACSDPAPDPEPPPAPPASGSEAPAGWQRLAPAPSERTEVAAALAGRTIVVAGGYRADGATVPTVELFDLDTGRWSAGPPLPLAVNHAMAATVGGKAHVFGGYTGGNAPATAAYRLDGDRWTALAPLPAARAAGTAVAIGDRVYVAAGIAPGGTLAAEMLVYDAAANRWSTVPGPPTRREHLGGAAAKGLVYTVGGRTSGAGNLGAVEAFDPASGRWEKLPDLPTARGGLAATGVCDSRVVAIGGEELGAGGETFDEVELFEVAERRWFALPGLPTPRHGLGVVAAGSTVYVLAGGPKPGLFVSAATESLPLRGC